MTGILLAFYYQPAASTAYESVRYITEDARFGWYLRSLHKWAATLMIAAVILHQMRVYLPPPTARRGNLTGASAWRC